MFDRSTIVWATVLTKKDAGQQRHSSCVFVEPRRSQKIQIALRHGKRFPHETKLLYLVRLLLTVGNSKHVLVGPLGRDVPLRPRTTNHILSLYSFRVLDKLTFYKKKLNTIKNLAPKSTIKVISCSNENDIFLKFQIFKKKDVPLFKGMNESVYLYVTMVCSGLMKTMIYQYINIYFKSLTNVKFVVHFL